MVVGVWLLPWHLHIPFILLETSRRTSTETCGLDMFPPDAHLKTHFMFDIHISKVIVLHSEEQGFLFCCLFCVQAAI